MPMLLDKIGPKTLKGKTRKKNEDTVIKEILI